MHDLDPGDRKLFEDIYLAILMLIGIMSDAHDNIQGVRDALKAFSKKGVKLVLFAGDMIELGRVKTFREILLE